MIVMKFGGTSLGNGERMENAASLVESFLDKQPVVVVSAVGGVTDILLSTAKQAASGDKSIIQKNIGLLLEKHDQVIADSIKDKEKAQFMTHTLINSLKQLYESIHVLGELTPRSLDLIGSYGERLSSLLFSFVLNEKGIDSSQIVSDSLIVTDDHFGEGHVFIDITTANVQRIVLPLVESRVVPVITGFIGATQTGVVTTLGRSGSDYSASIIGSCLGADEVWIWTDVDGVLTANPKMVSDARTISNLSYKEAAELSYFGAKVIHPKTMRPAVAKQIPIRIKNTFNPDHPGTVIVKDKETNGHPITGISSIENLSLITVEGAGMFGVPQIASKSFSVMASLGVNVYMISQSSSEHSICFVVHEDDSQRSVDSLKSAFMDDIDRGNIENISVMDGVSIVAVVGENMVGQHGLAGRLFGCLGEANVNIIAIAQGSSELNVTFVVDGHDFQNALTVIHKEFMLAEEVDTKANPSIHGSEKEEEQ